MKIYFACTIRGDRSRLGAAKSIVDALKAKGHDVMTERFIADEAAENDSVLSLQEVYERDMKWLHECDAFVAEVSGSSYGVGFEVGYVLGAMDKKVYLFYHKDSEERISRLATGNTHRNCIVVPYSDNEEIEKFISENF